MTNDTRRIAIILRLHGVLGEQLAKLSRDTDSEAVRTQVLDRIATAYGDLDSELRWLEQIDKTPPVPCDEQIERRAER